MNGTHILNHHRDILADKVRERNDLPSFDPLDISPWLAMSLMQKAIRRGREELALGGAATLLKISPERLWRRLCVTAYEDIGVADFDAVSLVTAGMKGKTWRSQVGSEWAVASLMVSTMCAATKCRATDDLLVVCEKHPTFEHARLDLTFQPVPQLLDRAMGRGAIPERALALWYAIGTKQCRSSVLRERRGEPDLVLDAMCESGIPDTVVEVCREGLRKSSLVLSPFLILLWQEARRAARHAEPDDLPDEEMVGGVPCWAYDMHVREGNKAMARLLETDCETARWVADRIPQGKRCRFLGGMLFRVESGLVDRRLRWDAGDRLRRMADLKALGLSPEDMVEGLSMLRQDLPKLHEERRHVVGSNSR
jgi:hypothetical protein